jgi:hypothetical protein
MKRREGIKEMIFSNSIRHNMMRECVSTINAFLFSRVSIELDGVDGV